MKRNIVIIAALVAGLAAAILSRIYISSKEGEVRREKEALAARYGTMEVLAYANDTPAGTVLSANDLGKKRVPKMALRGEAVEIEHFRDVLGRKILIAHEAGEVLFWGDIEGGDTSSKGLSADVRRQMRAMSINVSGAAAVSGMVKPNDHVDVIGTFDFPSDEGKLRRGDPVTCTILQNVLVLATGRDTAKTQSRSFGSAQGYTTVTLQVTPREAEMLAFAEQIRGRLILTLRNPNDTSTEKELPTVDFSKIRSEIEELNRLRQSGKL